MIRSNYKMNIRKTIEFRFPDFGIFTPASAETIKQFSDRILPETVCNAENYENKYFLAKGPFEK